MMTPRQSPSWPELGQVQKLTDLFEEKSLPQKGPQILKNPEPMPKLNSDLMIRIKTALGEEDPPKETMTTITLLPVQKPNPDDFYETKSAEDIIIIGDGGDNVARPPCARTYPDFEHFIP